MPKRSTQGDSTDYDTEADEQMKEVLATLPPLPVQPTTTPTPSPPPSRVEQVPLSRKAIHGTPLASEAEQAKTPLSPNVQAVLDEAKRLEIQREEAKKKKQK